LSSPFQIRRAAFFLRAGGVIAYPTETVYGLGCDPLDGNAVQRILELKRRPHEKGLILIAATLDQLHPFIDINNPTLLDKLTQQNDRPTTWICPCSPLVPDWLRGEHNSIAVRISSHPTVVALCHVFNGAIVSTSANPAGLQPSQNTLMVRRYFNDKLDYVVNGPTRSNSQPSRIIDLMNNKIIRE